MHAVIADVHSNACALRAFLSKEKSVSGIINAGDIVGYGPRPGECVALCKKRCMVNVLGNHDFAAITGDVSKHNRLAQMAMRLNISMLGSEHFSFLKSLPEKAKLRVGHYTVYVCHGSPLSMWEYVYESASAKTLNKFLEATGADVIVMGHTHRLFVRKLKNGWVLNPGSIGQPRDGNPRPGYLLVDFSAKPLGVEAKRFSYDIASVEKKMKELGFPSFLYERLYDGF